MPGLDLKSRPHRRYNALSGEWILVSPHRAQRPWQGHVEKPTATSSLSYDPACYLCPGNERAHGVRNPRYESTFVFDNDFAALLPHGPDKPAAEGESSGLIRAESERGVCRVVCFSPRHDLTLADMPRAAARNVVDVWAAESAALGAIPFIRYVQIFENRGAMMGASNPHPHCQIWATETVPVEAAKEQSSFDAYRSRGGRCLLCDYLELETQAAERIVFANQYFTVLVPFWALWPYETLVIAKRHLGAIEQLTSPERDSLAAALRETVRRYDRLFECPFPYSMGFHQRPSGGAAHDEWHFHAHFYPPLLRSATVRKFMVGFEMLGTPQRDLTAEDAAGRLRELPGPQSGIPGE